MYIINHHINKEKLIKKLTLLKTGSLNFYVLHKNWKYVSFLVDLVFVVVFKMKTKINKHAPKYLHRLGMF